MKNIYLDYAATTPVDPVVKQAMEPYCSMEFGNPSSLHLFGQSAITAVDNAREIIADSIGARFREIIFTGSATEANNLALRGTLKAVVQNVKIKNKNDNAKLKNSFKPRIIISAIEHESVMETALDLEKDGIEVKQIPVDQRGIVRLDELEKALTPQTVLVSVMYANNEIGTVQPITKISEILRNFREQRARSAWQIANSKERVLGHLPLLHTDAVQAFQFLDCDVKKLGVDLMTLSAHKIYGPKGIGALYVRQKEHGTRNMEQRFSALSLVPCPLSPITTGGGQEFGLRSGTENVPAIVGFGAAVRIAQRLRKAESARLDSLKSSLWEGIKKIVMSAQINGVEEREFTRNSLLSLPNILSVHFPGERADLLLAKLNMKGVAVSLGPACSSRSLMPSIVVKALGFSSKRASETIRFSMGRFTKESEIRNTVKILRETIG